MLVVILFMITKRELRLHAQTLGSVRNRGFQADALGATQVLDRVSQAVACDAARCASQAIDRGAQAVARGAAHCAPQLLDRGARDFDARGDDRFASQVLDRSAQAAARGTVHCASQVFDRGFEAVFRGAARCSLLVLDLDVQAGASAVACGDAMLPHQVKNTRQMSRGAG